MNDPVLLSIADATDLATRALAAAGVAPAPAASTARALIRAEAEGQGGHGLSRVPSYIGQVKAGKVNGAAEPVLTALRPGAARVDAAHGFAYPAIDLALPDLVERTRACGIAACTIHHSHHFGVAGHPCETLAEQGLIAFVYGNSPKAMALWGGTKPVLGTNPIAFAAPMEGAPLVVDMAMTTVARGKILAARQVGGSIPEGWALDAQGQTTTDPVAALQGSMAPIGGAKGAALALMVEVMSAALAGASLGTEASSLFEPEGPPPNLGQSIIALDADLLSGGAFAERMATLAGLFEGTDGVRLPGSRRLAARARAADQGMPVNPELIAQIEAIAAG